MAELHATRISAMQALLDAAIVHTHCVAGMVVAGDLIPLMVKLRQRYKTSGTRVQKFRDRAAGLGSTVLIFAPGDGQTFRWWLFFSDGHPALSRERMALDVREKVGRITYAETFEMVRVARGGDKPSWTWRMLGPVRDELLNQLRGAVRNANAKDALRLARELRNMPGFGGVRNDRKWLLRQVRTDWQRLLGPELWGIATRNINWWTRRVPRRAVVQVARIVRRVTDEGATSAEACAAYVQNALTRERRGAFPSHPGK